MTKTYKKNSNFLTLALAGALIILGTAAYAPVEQPSLDELPSRPALSPSPSAIAGAANPSQTTVFSTTTTFAQPQQPAPPQFAVELQRPVIHRPRVIASSAEMEANTMEIAPQVQAPVAMTPATKPAVAPVIVDMKTAPIALPREILVKETVEQSSKIPSRWIILCDILLAAAVVSLVIFNVILWRSTRKMWVAQPVETVSVVSESERVATAMEKIAESIAKEADEPSRAAEQTAKTGEGSGKSRKKVA